MWLDLLKKSRTSETNVFVNALKYWVTDFSRSRANISPQSILQFEFQNIIEKSGNPHFNKAKP